MVPHTRTARFPLAAICTLTASLLITGCGSHGRYTKEHVSNAKLKMNMLKAATEYQMAHQAFLAGDLEKAATHVDYSIGLSEKVTKSHVLKGRVLMEMGALERATLSFKNAEQLDPKSVEAAYYQGVLAERVARKDEALTHYQHAEEIDPTNAQYCIAAAEMMIDLGNIDQADTYLRERLERFVNNAGVKQVLGNIAMLRHDTKTAQVLFSEARLLDGENDAIIENLIRAQIANGDYADAEVNLARMVGKKQNKGRRDLMHMRGKCLVQLDRPIEARDLFLELTKDQSGAADVEAWRGLGQVAFTMRDMQRVKLCAARLIAIAPNNPDGWVLRGLMNRRAGDLLAAKMNFEQALRLKPEGETYIMLGMVQQDLHLPEQARASYAQALAKDPENTSARQLLATVVEN